MYPIEDGNGLGTSYDWNLWTVPQKHLDGLSRPYDMGRGIGGGSLINGMCWTRGGKADYDAWVTLGNAGWFVLLSSFLFPNITPQSPYSRDYLQHGLLS